MKVINRNLKGEEISLEGKVLDRESFPELYDVIDAVLVEVVPA